MIGPRGSHAFYNCLDEHGRGLIEKQGFNYVVGELNAHNILKCTIGFKGAQNLGLALEFIQVQKSRSIKFWPEPPVFPTAHGLIDAHLTLEALFHGDDIFHHHLAIVFERGGKPYSVLVLGSDRKNRFAFRVHAHN